ncbi:type IIL restriction-modification enzyme MmeI [Spirulina major]|uniref:type IIL restriction-modification enzyme MmeI n=1 Tax=Spirulina major TaxID=270636 RepID=UPI0009331C8C|nr:type IIL restriction-modification enzyme MmeI [Spirulina major]
MDQQACDRVEAFLNTWSGSQGNERANAQPFFNDLCDALGVDRPPPKGSVEDDPYCYDKDIRTIDEGLTFSIDLCSPVATIS